MRRLLSDVMSEERETETLITPRIAPVWVRYGTMGADPTFAYVATLGLSWLHPASLQCWLGQCAVAIRPLR